MLQLETYHGPGSEEQHGYSGPIHISGGTYQSPRAENAFMSAIQKVGWPKIEDLGDLDAGMYSIVLNLNPNTFYHGVLCLSQFSSKVSNLLAVCLTPPDAILLRYGLGVFM